MMGISEIRKASRDPQAYAKSRMSDGQLRRNDVEPSNYWSETAPGPDSDLRAMANYPIRVIDNRLCSGKLPDGYHDALKLWLAVDTTASQARTVADTLKGAIRASVGTDGAELDRTVAAIMNLNPLVDLHLLTGSLMDFLNKTLPEPHVGYNPNMGLSHLGRTLRGYVSKMQVALAKIDIV